MFNTKEVIEPQSMEQIQSFDTRAKSADLSNACLVCVNNRAEESVSFSQASLGSMCHSSGFKLQQKKDLFIAYLPW